MLTNEGRKVNVIITLKVIQLKKKERIDFCLIEEPQVSVQQ